MGVVAAGETRVGGAARRRARAFRLPLLPYLLLLSSHALVLYCMYCTGGALGTRWLSWTAASIASLAM